MTPRIRRALPFAGLVLGLSMGLANLMSYVFVALVSATLGPEDFGGFSALNTYGVMLAMPAGAFQVIVARRQTDAHRAAGRHLSALGSSLTVGLVLALVTICAAGLIADILRLESPWAVVWMALMLPPMTVTGALQGVLLGRESYGRLSAVYLATAGTRLVAAGAAVVWSFDVTRVFAAILVAALVTAGVALLLTRKHLGRGHAAPRVGAVLDDLVRSNIALAGLMALSSIDVVLARTVLTDHDSGAYALAALFGKVVFWGTQFVALTVVPSVAAAGAGGARTRVRGSAAAVAVIGCGVALVCALFPERLVALSGGEAFSAAEPLLVWTAIIGTLWAITQVWLFAEMSRGRHVMTLIVWAGAAVEVLLVLLWLNDSLGEVLLAVGGTAAAVTLLGMTRVPKGAAMPSPESAETSEAMGLSRE